MTCIVCQTATTGPRQKFCLRCWLQLPREVRRHWWEKTNYGRKAPNRELVLMVRRTVALHRVDR
jgi:hypothetical protein